MRDKKRSPEEIILTGRDAQAAIRGVLLFLASCVRVCRKTEAGWAREIAMTNNAAEREKWEQFRLGWRAKRTENQYTAWKIARMAGVIPER
jgi:hypothetical protein